MSSTAVYSGKTLSTAVRWSSNPASPDRSTFFSRSAALDVSPSPAYAHTHERPTQTRRPQSQRSPHTRGGGHRVPWAQHSRAACPCSPWECSPSAAGLGPRSPLHNKKEKKSIKNN
jgi:hypothetical protein